MQGNSITSTDKALTASVQKFMNTVSMYPTSGEQEQLAAQRMDCSNTQAAYAKNATLHADLIKTVCDHPPSNLHHSQA